MTMSRSAETHADQIDQPDSRGLVLPPKRKIRVGDSPQFIQVHFVFSFCHVGCFI